MPNERIKPVSALTGRAFGEELPTPSNPAEPAPDVRGLAAEWERLEQAFHDAMPQGQGDTGDGGMAGRALCQFLYDNSEVLRAALSQSPATPEPSELREAKGQGFDAAVGAIRAWAAGMYSAQTQSNLIAVAEDLEANRATLLQQEAQPSPDVVMDWRSVRIPPFVVFDERDETYLAAEKWAEELPDATRFLTYNDAQRVAEQHGGREADLRVESYCVHDHPHLVRAVFEAARPASQQDQAVPGGGG